MEIPGLMLNFFTGLPLSSREAGLSSFWTLWKKDVAIPGPAHFSVFTDLFFFFRLKLVEPIVLKTHSAIRGLTSVICTGVSFDI